MIAHPNHRRDEDAGFDSMPDSQHDWIIDARAVRKTYPGFTLDVSLMLPPDTITGLVGLNGAGKTTLFRTLIGLTPVDGQEPIVFGTPVQELSAAQKSRIGVVLSDAFFPDLLHIRQLLPILQNMYPDYDDAWMKAKLQALGLPLSKAIKECSTGMLAKLKVLCALSHHPDLLILDEPTSGLDVLAREDVLDLLRAYMETPGRSILISSHISTDLESLCDDIYLIHEGHLLLHEEMDVIKDQYGVLKLTNEQYETMDRTAVKRAVPTSYGWNVLVWDRQFYAENHPEYVIETGSVDWMMELMVKGKEKTE